MLRRAQAPTQPCTRHLPAAVTSAYLHPPHRVGGLCHAAEGHPALGGGAAGGGTGHQGAAPRGEPAVRTVPHSPWVCCRPGGRAATRFTRCAALLGIGWPQEAAGGHDPWTIQQLDSIKQQQRRLAHPSGGSHTCRVAVRPVTPVAPILPRSARRLWSRGRRWAPAGRWS